MGYPRLYRATRVMARLVLTRTKTARDIARRAGIRSTGGGGAFPTTLAAFSLINSPDGYEMTYPGGDYAFPDGTASMTSVVDVTGFSRARLLVNGGLSGSTLSVSGLGADVEAELDGSLVVGDWRPITETGLVTLEWTHSAPSGGTATLGLCQLQAE